MTGWGIAFLASFAAGFLSSLGLGGGGVLVLYLTLALGMEQVKAGGVNLLFFLPAALAAVIIHGKQGRIDRRMAMRCLPFGLAAALLGSWLAASLSPAWLSRGFAVLILFMGVRELAAKGNGLHS